MIRCGKYVKSYGHINIQLVGFLSKIQCHVSIQLVGFYPKLIVTLAFN